MECIFQQASHCLTQTYHSHLICTCAESVCCGSASTFQRDAALLSELDQITQNGAAEWYLSTLCRVCTCSWCCSVLIQWLSRQYLLLLIFIPAKSHLSAAKTPPGRRNLVTNEFYNSLLLSAARQKINMSVFIFCNIFKRVPSHLSGKWWTLAR